MVGYKSSHRCWNCSGRRRYDKGSAATGNWARNPIVKTLPWCGDDRSFYFATPKSRPPCPQRITMTTAELLND